MRKFIQDLPFEFDGEEWEPAVELLGRSEPQKAYPADVIHYQDQWVVHVRVGDIYVWIPVNEILRALPHDFHRE